MRTLAQKRHNDWKKAIRKRNIDRERSGENLTNKDWYDNLHQYSKNKIHCSCPLCRAKTSKKYKLYGHGGTGGKHWSISDKRKLDEMEDQNQELDNE